MGRQSCVQGQWDANGNMSIRVIAWPRNCSTNRLLLLFIKLVSYIYVSSQLGHQGEIPLMASSGSAPELSNFISSFGQHPPLRWPTFVAAFGQFRPARLKLF